MLKKKAPDPYDIEISRRVHVLRVTRRMSQTELATELGVTFQQVQKYESGANRIAAGRLRRIAEVFDVPAAALIESGEGDAETTRDIFGFLQANDAVRLLESYARISDRKMQLVLVQLVGLLAEASDNERARSLAQWKERQRGRASRSR